MLSDWFYACVSSLIKCGSDDSFSSTTYQEWGGHLLDIQIKDAAQ